MNGERRMVNNEWWTVNGEQQTANAKVNSHIKEERWMQPEVSAIDEYDETPM